MNNKENIDPQKTRTIIKVVIAILSAILGPEALNMIGSHGITNLIFFAIRNIQRI